MWRKTRSPNPGSVCYGTDGNRNFDFHWNEGGSSNAYCLESYHGATAASEIEVQNIQNYMTGLNNVVFSNNIHSYGQMVLLPWSYTTERHPNYDCFMEVGREIADALEAVHGIHYEVGQIPDLLGVASGAANDWAIGVGNVPYGFGMELRDTGEYGFLLPPDQIQASGEETFAYHAKMAEIMTEEFVFFNSTRCGNQ